jgi:hypothetical protein
MSLLKQVVTMLFQKLVNKTFRNRLVTRLLTRLLTSCDNAATKTCQQDVFAIGL